MTVKRLGKPFFISELCISSLRVPKIEGEIEEIRLRERGTSISMQRIMNLLRERTGVPPWKLQGNCDSEREFSCQSAAIYLASYYPQMPCTEIAEHFATSSARVEAICESPFAECDMHLLAELQVVLEKGLVQRIPYNLKEGRPAYRDEVTKLATEGYETFKPTHLVMGPEETEDLLALRGLEEFYAEKDLEFDLESFWGGGDYDSWRVCSLGNT